MFAISAAYSKDNRDLVSRKRPAGNKNIFSTAPAPLFKAFYCEDEGEKEKNTTDHRHKVQGNVKKRHIRVYIHIYIYILHIHIHTLIHTHTRSVCDLGSTAGDLLLTAFETLMKGVSVFGTSDS